MASKYSHRHEIAVILGYYEASRLTELLGVDKPIYIYIYLQMAVLRLSYAFHEELHDYVIAQIVPFGKLWSTTSRT